MPSGSEPTAGGDWSCFSTLCFPLFSCSKLPAHCSQFGPLNGAITVHATTTWYYTMQQQKHQRNSDQFSADSSIPPLMQGQPAGRFPRRSLQSGAVSPRSEGAISGWTEA